MTLSTVVDCDHNVHLLPVLWLLIIYDDLPRQFELAQLDVCFFSNFSVSKHHTFKSNSKNHFPESDVSALRHFLWWTLGGDTWLIRAMCLLWAHLSVKFGGTIPLSWTERQRTKGAGLQCGGKRHNPAQSETNTSHIFTF